MKDISQIKTEIFEQLKGLTVKEAKQLLSELIRKLEDSKVC